MKRVLLTGMSGSGKSSIIAELAKQGHNAIDADSPEYSAWVSADGNPTGAMEGKDWLWQVDRMQALLSTDTPNTLFVSGCAENMGQFFKQFSLIILLTAPTDILLERLKSRSNNSYGKRPEEVAQVLNNIETIEPMLRQVAHHEINTSQPLADVVTRVLEITRGAP